MPNLFNDEIIKFNQYDIDLNRDNIFDTILNIRKNGFDRDWHCKGTPFKRARKKGPILVKKKIGMFN